MKQALRPLAAALLFAALGGSQSAPPKTYRISGVVINRATGQALSRVRIVMNPAGDSSTESETTTGSNGQFAFERVGPGMWSLYAERKGFLRQGFGERPGVPDSFTQVVTGPDGNSEGLTFPIDAPAVVTGKVTDEDGEPAIAAIEIIVEVETGVHRFQNIRNVPTDELGEFRIWDLPAVRCYLLAVTPAPERGRSEQAPASLAPTYYSNTTDPHRATLLDLKPGQEYKADFVLQRARGVSLNLEGESGSAGAMLTAEGPQGAEVIVGQLAPGQNTFFNVPPGRYKVTLFDQRTGDQSTRSVSVANENVTVAAPFSDAPKVTAKVRLVDADPSLLSQVAFFLHADGDHQTHARLVGPDGTLTIPGMSAGHYKFMIATRGLYIKSLTSENAPATDRMVDVPETGTVKLDVVVAGDGGEVAGKVRTGGKPVAPARVVLAPLKDSTNSADYKSYQTESDGSFRYDAVPPGDYVVFATTDFKLEFGNPAVLRKYLAAGKAVHVDAKGAIDLEIAPIEP
jgi:hypothetical protein